MTTPSNPFPTRFLSKISFCTQCYFAHSSSLKRCQFLLENTVKSVTKAAHVRRAVGKTQIVCVTKNFFGGRPVKKNGRFSRTFSLLPLIARCQFYYMDQFLLSASSNQLFVHQIGLPTSQQNSGQQSSAAETSAKYSDEFWFKYVHQVKLENCKNITAICAPNQVL